MSILIKDMEMPTSPVLFCVHPDGKVFADLEGNWREYKAVPVPPHGRLIDADALDYFKDDSGIAIFDFVTRGQIYAAPTIIEAEEGE